MIDKSEKEEVSKHGRTRCRLADFRREAETHVRVTSYSFLSRAVVMQCGNLVVMENCDVR